MCSRSKGRGEKSGGRGGRSVDVGVGVGAGVAVGVPVMCQCVLEWLGGVYQYGFTVQTPVLILFFIGHRLLRHILVGGTV